MIRLKHPFNRYEIVSEAGMMSRLWRNIRWRRIMGKSGRSLLCGSPYPDSTSGDPSLAKLISAHRRGDYYFEQEVDLLVRESLKKHRRKNWAIRRLPRQARDRIVDWVARKTGYYL